MRHGPQMFTEARVQSISGGTFIINNNALKPHKKGLKILEKRIALGAFHNSAERFDPPKCYPKTRQAILEKIEAWVKERPEHRENFVLWMYGPAGAGKSAIAQSIAELCEELLAATFFFSRTSEGRNDSSRLVATIAWQLIQAIPEIRDHVLSSLERDPTILFRTPATQMKFLVVDPLNSVPTEILIQRPLLVIVDGLDECLPSESQDDILGFLSTCLQCLHTPLYFLIASRPHTNIRGIFTSNRFRSITNTLPLEDDYKSTEDIRYFLTSSFEEIHQKYPYLPTPWPTTSDIDYLVEKSSGQFIYAATVIRYVARGRHGHESRLRTVLELPSSDNSVMPFATLDDLYLQIFQSIGKDDIGKVMEVLGALILLEDNKIEQLDILEAFLNYRPGELASVMEDLLALVHIPDSQRRDDVMVKIHHASLPDFLLDHTRSRSFYLDPATVYSNLARRCIKDHSFRRSTNCDRDERRDFRYEYERIFIECVIASPLTEGLSDILLAFSFWDDLPPQFPQLIDYDIGNMSMALLDEFQRESTDPRWAKILEAQLCFLDRWIYRIFSSAPQRFLPLLLVACGIYIAIEDENALPRVVNFTMLASLVHDFELETSMLCFFELEEDPFNTWSTDSSSFLSKFLSFALQRIPLVFKAKYCITGVHYTEFAIHCANQMLENVRKNNNNRAARIVLSSLCVYLARSLPHCHESCELAGFVPRISSKHEGSKTSVVMHLSYLPRRVLMSPPRNVHKVSRINLDSYSPQRNRFQMSPLPKGGVGTVGSTLPVAALNDE
ncbi:hypothetical protein M413DRAFT_450031 [Hebeloma cylindrosporum]|uniref:Nephrocystin 3-like N-terminal domain-containing protein n=1 Tax=Hebeloma cylindrosporum TaxID=76867 RepID=A0A0C3BS04_HEBCY|nr:hypothetical protein M413DRAFT_450031 [Hebeloma cylindrosporum h7]